MQRNKYILLLLLSIFLLTGCKEDKYANFKHYDLANNEKIVYNYMNDKGKLATYYLADISQKDDTQAQRVGLFYQIDKDDNILLDEMYPANDVNFKQKSLLKGYNYFYENKFYKKTYFFGITITEYTLNKEQTTKKDLSFDYSSIVTDSMDLTTNGISKIENNYIYFTDCSIKNEDSYQENLNIRCSLKDYKCEVKKE